MDRRAPIRVLVADDHDRIRIALAALLDTVADIEVVGFAVNGAHAVSLAGELAPDVVLMDVSMPVLDGIEATRRILKDNPASRIVTLTALRTRQDEARRAGASAQLLKDAPSDELIARIRAVVTEPSAPACGAAP